MIFLRGVMLSDRQVADLKTRMLAASDRVALAREFLDGVESVRAYTGSVLDVTDRAAFGELMQAFDIAAGRHLPDVDEVEP